jgi:2-polyprenyl-3-methyl-5-hydroxy-6-metoxy-1,4-benzoquinol methylase
MANKHAEQISQLYERHALAWDSDRTHGAWHDKVWHDRFIAHLSQGAQVLDLGCGSGVPVASHLARQGFYVTGVDTSETLITLCRQRMPEHEWIQARMQTLALHRQFGGILCWDSLFHLTHEDQRGMFSVFAAHATPGAFLLLNTGPEYGERIGTYQGEILYHASLDPSEYQQLLDQSGFTLITYILEDPCASGRTVWLAQA